MNPMNRDMLFKEHHLNLLIILYQFSNFYCFISSITMSITTIIQKIEGLKYQKTTPFIKKSNKNKSNRVRIVITSLFSFEEGTS